MKENDNNSHIDIRAYIIGNDGAYKRVDKASVIGHIPLDAIFSADPNEIAWLC
jgi:uncharacterized 2Fe-2S/4Fe-4S cluster protein (DUF4445 family)